MSRNRNRGKKLRPSDMDDARNELFSHIHRCGELQATDEQQVEWMDDTIEFLGERYPSLTDEELGELKAIGLRFCRPVIANAPAEEADEAEAADHAGAEEPAAA